MHCICSTRQRHDPDHPHLCVKTRACSVAARHHAVAKALAEAASNAGVTYTLESRIDPLHNQRRDDVNITLDNVTGTNFMIDVSIVHDTKQLAKTIEQGIVYRENAKISEYGKLSEEAKENRVFVPFILSSMGTVGTHADLLLQKLSDRAVEHGYAKNSGLFYQQKLALILVALHRGNAHIQNQGVANLRRLKPANPHAHA